MNIKTKEVLYGKIDWISINIYLIDFLLLKLYYESGNILVLID